MAERTRVSIEMDPALHEELRALAVQEGVSIRDLLLRAIRNELSEHKDTHLTAEEAPLLADLWDNDEDAVYDDL